MVWTAEPLMAEAEEEWLERLRKRDQDAFKELVARFAGPIKRYLTGMLRNPADGEELAQETFLRFLGGLSSFRGDSSVKTYLFRIAHNLALNHIASAASQHEIPMGGMPPEQPAHESPHRRAQASEESELLLRAVGLLPPQQRSVVLLRTWHDLPFKEIAQALSLAEGTVKAHYFFALRNLRRHLEESHDSR
jgi:RNA polymerase sigma-70 factor, ECF subfamily